MSNKKVITGSGNLVAGPSSMSGIGTVTPAVINEAIEKNIEIPPGAKEPIKDFITESFNESVADEDETIDAEDSSFLD